jgi:hypothetical protein
VSHLHRLKSDELWHFHAGTSITIVEIDQKNTVSRTVLGNDLNAVMKGEMLFSHCVKAGVWFGSYLNSTDNSSFSVVSCTVVPGFEYEDFEVLYQDNIHEFEI